MTVQGPVKKQYPDGMSHRGGRGLSELPTGIFAFNFDRKVPMVL